MDSRVRALAELYIPWSREDCGLHEYDGVVQDLSPAGVQGALARLGGEPGHPPAPDPYDETLLLTHEAAARVVFAELKLHRSSPIQHIQNLDLSTYSRPYAPAAERAQARRQHLRQWPTAIDAAVEALDEVPAPTAAALLPSAIGLAAGLSDNDPIDQAARTAHQRFVRHLTTAAEFGPTSAALGADGLARLMGTGEAIDVDLTRLAEIAEKETARLREILAEACAQIDPDAAISQTIAALHHDHPSADDMVAVATAWTNEVLAWVAEANLVPYTDGTCEVAIAPESRRAGTAALTWAGPYEADTPAHYWVSPPATDWSEAERADWLAQFSPMVLGAVTVHEVAPGHFSHSRALRRLLSDPRRVLHSLAFIEGWAHYAEELAVEEGFRADDPRFTIGVAVEGLVRCTRLVSAIGVHSGAFDIAEATRRFRDEAFLAGPAAEAEAQRATWDPTYGRYTWGKLELRRLRDEARARWHDDFSLAAFHRKVLELGSPPLGLLPTIFGS